MQSMEPRNPVVVLPTSGNTGAAARSARTRRRYLSWLRRGLLALVLLAGVVAGVVALLPKPVPVDLGRVTRGRLVVQIRETGKTRVKDRYVVSAPVTGSLGRLSLEPNDAVEEGKALAQIGAAPAPLLDERTRAQAEAELSAQLSTFKQSEAQSGRAQRAEQLAKRELERASHLKREGAISEEALEQAQFAAEMREDELASAVFARKVAAERVRLARAALAPGGITARPVAVVSPVSGNVLRVFQESAGVVSAGTPLLEVGDLDALEVVVDLLTTDAVQVRPGTPVSIDGWGGARAVAGRVRKVELAAFTRPSALGVDEQRANTVVVFSEPREHWATLGDGYHVEVTLTLWEGRDVVKVPQGALFRRGDGWAAFAVDRGIAKLVPVELGRRGETEVQVESGLEPGMSVVVDPGDRVEEGARVAER